MSSAIANMSLYIPHVFANISKKMVAETFENLRIGNVKRVDFVYKRGSNGGFNAVYIHFNYWYDNVAACNFQERVLDPNREARIVYDEPWYWIVLENKTKKASSDRKPRINLEALANSGYVTPPEKQMTNQDFANLFPLVHDLGVGDLEVFFDAEPAGLDFKMRSLDRAEQKSPSTRCVAEFQKIQRSR